jgi:hypothetical protein
MVVIAAYDMYIECCEGNLDEEWFVPEKDRMTFLQFRMTLSEQMLQYDPKDQLYPGESNTRFVTKMKKAKRKKPTAPTFARGGVILENFKKAKTAVGSRLCGSLDDLAAHMNSMRKTGNTSPCQVCGKGTAWKCDMCGEHMCVLNNRSFNGARCAIHYHNDSFFGLAKSDFKPLMNKAANQWVPPNPVQISRNAKHISTLTTIMEMEMEETEGEL